MMVRRRIALVAGSGRLPFIFADEAKKAGEYVLGLAIRNITPPQLESHVDKIYWGEIYDVKEALGILKSERIDHLVMTGNIPKAVIFNKNLRLDKDAQEVLRRTIDSKDYTIMKAIALRLRKEHIKVLDPTSYFSDLISKRGILTKRAPTKDEWDDIRFGIRIAKKISGMDIGQTVVIRKKLVLAIEAIEGTDKAIRRAGSLNGEGAVVIKVARPWQDMRFDIPTIGPETIDSLIDAKAAVLAIEAKRMLVVDKDELIRKADTAGISVVAI